MKYYIKNDILYIEYKSDVEFGLIEKSNIKHIVNKLKIKTCLIKVVIGGTLIATLTACDLKINTDEVPNDSIEIEDDIKDDSNEKPIISDKHVTIRNRFGVIETLNLEDYVIGVVAGELPASFHVEALKSQAIASRTYSLYREDKVLEITTVNQVYIDIEQMKDMWKESFDFYYNKIKSAVEDTKGKYITYDNKIIDALYFAYSNGYTENSEDVYNFSIPYLKSVESNYDLDLTFNKYEVTFHNEDFMNKLGISNTIISSVSYTIGNSVNRITIGNKTFTGTEFRSLLGLRSADFTIEEIDDEISIITSGFGHQVGMSQWGSYKLAINGYTHYEILNHYYNNVSIDTLL